MEGNEHKHMGTQFGCEQIMQTDGLNNHLQIGTDRGHILVAVHFNLSPYECEHMDKNSRGVSA